MKPPCYDPDAIDPPRVFRGRKQSIFAYVWNNPGVTNRELAIVIFPSRELCAARKEAGRHIHGIRERLEHTPWELRVTPVRGICCGRRPKSYKIIKRTNPHARPNLSPSLPRR